MSASEVGMASDTMQQLQRLSPLQQRKVAAIVGACVADAAAQPLHWIYKEGVLKSLTEGREEIEFRVPSANPFYRIPTGSNTCYGDQAYVMLKSLVDCKGLDIEQLIQANYAYFGPQSAYESSENSNYQVGKEDKINIKKSLPIHGPWRNGSLKEFITNVNSNTRPTGSSTDDQIDCVIRMVPLVAWLAGQPNLLEKVEQGLAVLQSSDIAIACALAAARVLEQYILQGSPKNVLQTAIDQISDSKNPNPHELDKAVVGQLRSVIKACGTAHYTAVKTFFKNN